MAALPYMQLYIADYLADTSHLTTLQHGAYLLLIFNYWQRGKPLSSTSERLASVARMSNEEWKIIEPVLAEFFKVTDSEWIHHRIESDLLDVLSKSTKASAAGKASARKRYGNRDLPFNERSTGDEPLRTDTDTDAEPDAEESYPTTPKNGVSDVISKEEAKRLKKEAKDAERQAAKEIKIAARTAAKEELKKLREAKKKADKKASPPTQTEYVKTRHAEFKVAIFEYWKSKNKEIDCPWQQAEGMQLELWLKSSPNTTITKFKEMLRNRYRSEVVHSERPSVWIKNITSYANGPLNTFRQPLNSGGKTNGRSADRAFATAANVIQEIEDSHGTHAGELLSGSGAN
jgi:uncharacterized protein YdaU (DUF1376 family)